MAGCCPGLRLMNGSAPGHKGKRFLFTGKYCGCLVTSNDRKGNAEKAEGSSGPCSWPALTHCDLKPSHFYSCSSICQVEGSPALHRSHGIPKTACHLRVKSKEQAPGFVTFLLIGPLASALRLTAFSFAFGERHGAMLSWGVATSGWHQAPLAPERAIPIFPMNKKRQVQNVLREHQLSQTPASAQMPVLTFQVALREKSCPLASLGSLPCEGRVQEAGGASFTFCPRCARWPGAGARPSGQPCSAPGSERRHVCLDNFTSISSWLKSVFIDAARW